MKVDNEMFRPIPKSRIVSDLFGIAERMPCISQQEQSDQATLRNIARHLVDELEAERGTDTLKQDKPSSWNFNPLKNFRNKKRAR